MYTALRIAKAENKRDGFPAIGHWRLPPDDGDSAEVPYTHTTNDRLYLSTTADDRQTVGDGRRQSSSVVGVPVEEDDDDEPEDGIPF